MMRHLRGGEAHDADSQNAGIHHAMYKAHAIQNCTTIHSRQPPCNVQGARTNTVATVWPPYHRTLSVLGHSLSRGNTAPVQPCSMPCRSALVHASGKTPPMLCNVNQIAGNEQNTGEKNWAKWIRAHVVKTACGGCMNPTIVKRTVW